MSALAKSKSHHFYDEDDQDVLIQFDENSFVPVTPYQEDFEDQVNEAQEQLLQLRQKQEMLERQKLELEELQRRKEEFTHGRAEVTEQLSQSIAHLEREAARAQQLAEECLDSKESFEQHLRIVEMLRPEHWSRADLRDELTRALACIEDAEQDIAQAGHLLEVRKAAPKGVRVTEKKSTASAAASREQGFLHWFKCGLAFTLPLMIFVGVALLLLSIFGAGN
ncbi:MAG: hypothetical protein KDM91_15595 [Verrucomicrobiae bacterium]|nr:hypothetical protein [Verrucomicrobiae bacterium]MCP5539697.1 hypothetical protein [Akkermansiaceae bacterium]